MELCSTRPFRVTCHDYLILHALISGIILVFGDIADHSAHYAISSTLLLLFPSYNQIFNSAPYSQTPSAYVSHPYKTTRRIIVVCILIYAFGIPNRKKMHSEKE